jgi:beta-lactamase superfamily II metal-dependent hydrolase
MKLHVIQAEYGDCFVLSSEMGKKSTTILIDGGPYQTFEKHLKPALQKLPKNGKLDLVVLSHIDNDHIIGLVDLFGQIKDQREKGLHELVKITKLWHNSFNYLLQTDEDPNSFFKKSILSMNFDSEEEKKKMENSIPSIIMTGFQQASDLSSFANSLKIPINPEFDKLIMEENALKTIKFNDITFHILGPSKKNLDKLRKEWAEWHDKNILDQKLVFDLIHILDKSIPNLSSIMLLAASHDKNILFTGDGSADDVINALSEGSMLDNQGKFHVDVLKVPHHGSDRNVTPDFFNTVTADYYVISANGRDDNPSVNTLKWIIESVNKTKKPKTFVFTNSTPNIEQILKQYDQNKYNYKCIFLKGKEDFLTVNL